MNIIQHRQQQRREMIDSIVKTLKNSEKFKNGEFSRKELVLLFCSQLNIAKRTVSEYLDIALFELKNEV